MPRIHGLTLIELIIALAIMAILMALAYPVYDQQMQRARRADAISALQLIALAQERYYTVHGAYTISLSALDVAPSLQSGESENGYYVLALSNNDDDQIFIATATATDAQLNDSNCQQFSLNQLNIKSALDANDAVKQDCW